MGYLRRLRGRHWAWIHFLLAVGVAWPLFVIFSPPEFIIGFLDPIVLTVSMWVALIGTLTTIWGYASSQQEGRIGVIGISIELAGLILAIVGPASYAVTRIFILLSPESVGLSSGLFFSYALFAVFLYRLVVVVPRFRFEARDPAKE